MKHYVVDEKGRMIGMIDIDFSTRKFKYIKLPIQKELVYSIELDGNLYRDALVLDKLFEADTFTIWSVIERDRGVVNCLKGFHSFIYE